MGCLRNSLRRIEKQVENPYKELSLPDGNVLRYRSEEAVDAFGAAVGGEEHPLVEPFVAAETTTGFSGLVRSLVLSRELVEEEEEER